MEVFLNISHQPGPYSTVRPKIYPAMLLVFFATAVKLCWAIDADSSCTTPEVFTCCDVNVAPSATHQANCKCTYHLLWIVSEYCYSCPVPDDSDEDATCVDWGCVAESGKCNKHWPRPSYNLRCVLFQMDAPSFEQWVLLLLKCRKPPLSLLYRLPDAIYTLLRS